MAYAVFESSNLQSTHFAKRIFDVVANQDIENGTIGYLNGLADGYDVIYNFKTGVKDGAVIVVADQPAWSEDTSRITNQRRDNFIIKAGTPFRARVIAISDEFAISAEGFSVGTKDLVINTTDFKANDVYVTVDTDGKLVASNSSIPDAIFEGKVMRKRVVGGVLTTNAHTYGHSYALYEVKVEVAKGGNC